MSEQSLHRRRADLIRQINEIEDEELLVSLEDQIFAYNEERATDARPIPDILRFPSTEKLHAMIDQVLEDDRNGRMIDGDEFFREFEKRHNIRCK